MLCSTRQAGGGRVAVGGARVKEGRGGAQERLEMYRELVCWTFNLDGAARVRKGESRVRVGDAALN